MDRELTVPSDLSGVKQIVVGGAFTIALLDNGTVQAWGDDQYGEINVPGSLTGVKAIAAGMFNGYALRTTAPLWVGETILIRNKLSIRGYGRFDSGRIHSRAGGSCGWHRSGMGG